MTSPTPAERRVVQAVMDELDRQHKTKHDGPYTYMGLAERGVDIATTDDFDVGIDGHVDLLELARALSRSAARPATEPPEHGRSVLMQYKLHTPFTTLTCQNPAWYDHSRELWVLECKVDHTFGLQCWWEYPELLNEQQLRDIGPEPAPVEDPMPDAVAFYLLKKAHGGACPKCGQNGGDSWGDCQGSCPIPGSPQHNDAETLRQFLPSLRS